MIIAAGVNKNPSPPMGPERDSIRYTTSPATTGGSPISAFTTTMTTDRPGNGFMASNAPAGIPITAAISTAVSETCNDTPTIPTNSGSRLVIIESAAAKALSDICTLPYLLFFCVDIRNKFR